MNKKITLKYKDFLNAAKFIEKHCKEDYVNLTIDLATIEIECDNKKIKLSDKEHHTFPKVLVESILEEQID